MSEQERYSPRKQTGRSFDDLMRAAISIPQEKAKKKSKPKKKRP